MNESNDKQAPFLRTIAVYLIVILLVPVALLGVLELSLRLGGFGQTYPLFVPSSQQTEYLMPNPNLIKRFFHMGSETPSVSPDTVYFKQQKSPHSLRVVVMGGSTAAGFPYGRFGSPAGMLQYQLIAMYPERDIEVISVAMSSVNSYALRDIADEVVAINPDAVIIYSGHNEYLGVMGVGSNYSLADSYVANLLFLKLKNLRLFQLMQWLLASGPDSDSGEESSKIYSDPISSQGARTVMAKMAKERHIAFDSELYRAGLEQFANNLRATIDVFKQHRIPVVIGNLVANEKSLAPFESLPKEGLSLLQGHSEEKQLAIAMSNIEQYPTSADAHYALGQLYLAETSRQQALSHLQQALNFDTLRFRAPTAFASIIRQLASADGVTLADVEAKFRQHSQLGIIGSELMLEHVHPNVAGYELLSEALVESLLEALSLPAVKSPTSKHTLTPVDEATAAHKIAVLTSDYPFKQTEFIQAGKTDDSVDSGKSSHAANSVTSVTQKPIALGLRRFIKQREEGYPWLKQQPELLHYFESRRNWQEAAKVISALSFALPFDGQLAFAAANAQLRVNDIKRALFFARRAVQLEPTEERHLLTLAECWFKDQQTNKARHTLEQVLLLNPANTKAKQYLRLLKQEAVNKKPEARGV